jgi:hypothetical protein
MANYNFIYYLVGLIDYAKFKKKIMQIWCFFMQNWEKIYAKNA